MENLKFSRKIRIGLIGASPDTWIGSIHHNSFLMDNLYELVSGSFSRDSKKSQDIGSKLHLNPKRVYESWEEFLEKEATMEKDVKIDVVVIVTPNNLHYAPSKKALSLGFHVILDKPLCINLEEAYDLEFTIKKNDLLFCLTHCYTGYPMIKEAKSLIKNGKIGKLRKVIVDYPQGWLTTRLELFNYNAKNRQQPDIAGKSCT